MAVSLPCIDVTAEFFQCVEDSGGQVRERRRSGRESNFSLPPSDGAPGSSGLHFSSGSADARASKTMSEGSFDSVGLHGLRRRHDDALQQQTLKPSEFSTRAAEFARRVHDTTGKLNHLTRLVRNGSMFDDKTTEINRLSFSIKNDVTGLKTSIDELAASMGKSKSKQDGAHAQRVVKSLELQLGKTTKNFQGILQDRARNLRDQQEQRAKLGYGHGGGASALGKPIVFGQAAQAQADTPTRINSASVSSPLRLQQNQLMNRNTAYLESRADAVQTINQTMGEL